MIGTSFSIEDAIGEYLNFEGGGNDIEESLFQTTNFLQKVQSNQDEIDSEIVPFVSIQDE